MAQSRQRRKAATDRRRKAAGRATDRPRTARYWSGRVTKESDALDLERGVFILKDPKRIAASLKRSAERSRRRKADPYRSALSMLVFYINRAGKHLSPARKRTLERAKGELKKLFGKPTSVHRTGAPRARSSTRSAAASRARRPKPRHRRA